VDPKWKIRALSYIYKINSYFKYTKSEFILYLLTFKAHFCLK
jgi:hypothetical protein